MPAAIQMKQVSVNGVSVCIAEAGTKGNQVILFLHGYPQTHLSFKDVMNSLSDRFHVLAIDLPGIGLSWPIPTSDKKSIANFIAEFIRHQKLNKIILCGHDAGGMITYAFIRNHVDMLAGAIMMNTAIPGVPPWEEVKRNPYIWHFAFYAIPTLPETLILGKERPLFDYFFDTLSSDRKLITAQKRAEYTAAYQKPESLRTSLGWYRTFMQDEKDNADESPVNLPVLYLRGEKEPGEIKDYADGFRKKGLRDVTVQVIESSGHFAADENPAGVAKAIREFAEKVKEAMIA